MEYINVSDLYREMAELEEKLRKELNEFLPPSQMIVKMGELNGITHCKHLVADFPKVDAEPVRHGHNENKEYHEVDEFRCSECGLHLEDWTKYVYDEDSNEEYVQEYVFKRCPECGAKMDGD